MAYDVITPTKLASAELATSMSTYRTVPTGTRDIVTTVTLANNHDRYRNVSVHLVESGGSVGDANALFPSVKVDPATTVVMRISHVMNGGDTIQAFASGSGVSMIISGGNAE